MERKEDGRPGTEFPRIDRTAISVAKLTDPSDEKKYRRNKSTEERLEALELMPQIVYGYDPATTRLQRIIEFVEYTPR